MAINTFFPGTGIKSAPVNSNFNINNALAKTYRYGEQTSRDDVSDNVNNLQKIQTPFLKKFVLVEETNNASYSLETAQYVSQSAVTSIISLWDYQVVKNIRTTNLQSSATAPDPGTTEDDEDDTTDISGKSQIYLKFDKPQPNSDDSGGSYNRAYIRLTDGTNEATLWSDTRKLGASEGYMYIYIDWTNKKATAQTIYSYQSIDNNGNLDIWHPGEMETTEVDLSSFSTALYVRASTETRDNIGGSGSGKNTTLNIRKIYSFETTTSTVTESVSTDGGSSFTTGTGAYTGLTSGSLIVGKIDGNIAADETLFISSYLITKY